MSYYFSKSKKGFYPESLKNIYEDVDSWPSDAVKIEDSVYSEYTGLPPKGKMLSGDKMGFPTWEDLPELTEKEIILHVNNLRRLKIKSASVLMEPLQYAVDLGMATEEEENSFLEWKKYIVLLNRIPQQEGYPRDISWPIEPST